MFRLYFLHYFKTAANNPNEEPVITISFKICLRILRANFASIFSLFSKPVAVLITALAETVTPLTSAKKSEPFTTFFSLRASAAINDNTIADTDIPLCLLAFLIILKTFFLSILSLFRTLLAMSTIALTTAGIATSNNKSLSDPPPFDIPYIFSYTYLDPFI